MWPMAVESCYWTLERKSPDLPWFSITSSTPLNRSTLIKILEVREASQRR